MDRRTSQPHLPVNKKQSRDDLPDKAHRISWHRRGGATAAGTAYLEGCHIKRPFCLLVPSVTLQRVLPLSGRAVAYLRPGDEGTMAHL